jgi:hypothetical protein
VQDGTNQGHGRASGGFVVDFRGRRASIDARFKPALFRFYIIREHEGEATTVQTYG